MHRVTVALALLLALATASLPAARQAQPAPAGWDGLRVLMGALADRFGPLEREPGYESLRPRLGRAGLVPSPLYNDPSAWMTRGDNWRALDLTGYASGGLYHVGVRAEAPRPATPGQYRSRMRLQRITDGRFEWTVSDELAVGQARPADISGAVDTLFRGADRSTAASARDALAKALPRAAAQFSHLFRVETLTLTPDARGATSVQLAVRLTPAGIRSFAPRYAAFLEKYAKPIRGSLVVSDTGGARWWTLEAADYLWTLRLRVRDGSLVPLEGSAEGRLPARLHVTANAATRMGLFTVGARHIVADVALTRTPDEHGFSARFLEEPDWDLPFLVETVLNSPLRYPFDTPGSEIAWAARETAGGNQLVRRYRARVRESWILRRLGGLVNDAVGDFRSGAEREADLYHRACLLALRQDLAALDAAR